MADFKKAYDRIIKGHEGGYVNDPTDRGGETYKGISRKHHPEWEGWKIIDDLRKRHKEFTWYLEKNLVLQNLVVLFYKMNYWDTVCGDMLKFQEVADELLDIGVNMGVVTAIKFLQQSVNMLNKDQHLWKDVKVDGIIGPRTLGATNQASQGSLTKCLNGLQFMRYKSICEGDTRQEKYMHGWLTRV